MLRKRLESTPPVMETFNVNIMVGHFKGGEMVEISAAVGDESPYMMLPESLLSQLGICPERERLVEFADGTAEMRRLGNVAVVAHNDERMVSPVIFGRDNQCLLGRLTPGFLSLEVDHVGKRLVPAEYEARFI